MENFIKIRNMNKIECHSKDTVIIKLKEDTVKFTITILPNNRIRIHRGDIHLSTPIHIIPEISNVIIIE